VARPTDQSLILADLAEVRRACADRARPLALAHFNFVHVVQTDDHAAALAVQRIEFERVMGTHRPFAAVEASYLLGTPAEIRAKLGTLMEAGFTQFILGPLTSDSEQLELIHDEIVRPLSDGAREGKDHRHVDAR
jgi:hypothetical protein